MKTEHKPADYSRHEIVERSESRVRLQRPNDCCVFEAEIINTKWGVAIVGDGPNLIFANYHSRPLESNIAWLASSSPDYLLSKISGDTGQAYLPDLARKDIQDLFETSSEYDYGGNPDHQEAAKKWIEEHVRCFDDKQEVQQAVADHFPEGWEHAGDVGMAPSFELVSAIALCKRAFGLLRNGRPRND